MPENIYGFSAQSLKGETVSLGDYRGQVVLIVNTASKCGFTPQYAGLQELYEKHKDEGFVVLGFPCNQFASQEPGGAAEIELFCRANYGVSFPMFSKIDVNGKNTHPLFKYLADCLPGMLGRAIKWNFTKFLVSDQGVPVKRYGSTTKPKKIETDVVELLRQSKLNRVSTCNG